MRNSDKGQNIAKDTAKIRGLIAFLRQEEEKNLSEQQKKTYKPQNLKIDEKMRPYCTDFMVDIFFNAKKAKAKLVRFLNSENPAGHKYSCVQNFFTTGSLFFFPQKLNWTCGYRNAQVLMSSLLLCGANPKSSPTFYEKALHHLIIPDLENLNSKLKDTNLKRSFSTFSIFSLSTVSNASIISALDDESFDPVASAKRKMITVKSLQKLIERGWNLGFDIDGGKEYFSSKLTGKKDWIGTVEIVSLLRSFGLRAVFVDFDFKNKLRGPSNNVKVKNKTRRSIKLFAKSKSRSFPEHLVLERIEDNMDNSPLVSFCWNYFSGKPFRDFIKLNKNLAKQKHLRTARNFITPLYFQHQGHSRTMIGIERVINETTKGYKTYFLMLDPAKREADVRRKHENCIKVDSRQMNKNQYQVVFIAEQSSDRGVMSANEAKESMVLEPLFKYFWMNFHLDHRNQDATLYVGNLDDAVDGMFLKYICVCIDELLWELFTQCGPVASVSLPRDRVSGKHQGFGFIEFRYERDADYATKILNMIKLYEKPMNIRHSREGTNAHDIGANIFIGNLDYAIDEDMLYNTFAMFGGMVKQPKIPLDPDTGKRRNFGLVFYDSFEASDMAIKAMQGQFLGSRQISVQYAYKQDSPGQRHGSQAERLLAEELKKTQGRQVLFRPNTNFASPADIARGQPITNAPGMPVVSAPPPAQAVMLGYNPTEDLPVHRIGVFDDEDDIPVPPSAPPPPNQD